MFPQPGQCCQHTAFAGKNEKYLHMKNVVEYAQMYVHIQYCNVLQQGLIIQAKDDNFLYVHVRTLIIYLSH